MECKLGQTDRHMTETWWVLWCFLPSQSVRKPQTSLTQTTEFNVPHHIFKNLVV